MKQQATAPCGCPIRHNSSCAATPKFISAWFMRDNHTFAPIKDRDVPGIVARVREVFDGPMGHCGSLFARYQPSDVTIEVLTFHFHEPWDEFPEAAIRQWAHTLAALDAALLPEGEK